jgi:uncharacterized phage protein (TIGR02218 family)
MRTISPAMLTAIGQDLTTLCRLWTINKLDGSTLYFTDHPRDLVIGGNTYRAANSFTASAFSEDVNSMAKSIDIDLILDEVGIDYFDLSRGLYDRSLVSLSVVSYADPELDPILLFTGKVLSVQLVNKSIARLSLGGVHARLAKQLCEQYTAKCRAVFGDARCKVDLEAYSAMMTVTHVGDRQAFSSTDLVGLDDWYWANGSLLWLTGRNAHTRIEVVTSTGDGGLYTLLPSPYPVEVGDTAVITKGCDNTVEACTAYNNLANYRGEPRVPNDE